jgi:hypothetical protein
MTENSSSGWGDDYDPEELEIEEINEILYERDWLKCSTADW